MSFVKHIFNKETPDKIQIADVQRLIENKIEESLSLDFEQIPRTDIEYDGLARHISGFLNTSGGIVVFGLSEKTEKGRNIPYNITWTTIKKETLENNLYQRIDPWCEDIQIFPLQNPDDPTQRIFIVFVPKSKNPPHMANYTYYTRLNFQTQPMGNEQVSTIFRQYYLQKYDFVNTVYTPIYNELGRYYRQKRIKKWSIEEFEQIRKQRLFLLLQDTDLYLELDTFYQKVSKWNKAVDVVQFRIANIINDVASEFFKEKLRSTQRVSAVEFEVRTESTDQFPRINEAILNKRDPVDFGRKVFHLTKYLRSFFFFIHLTRKQVKTLG